MRELGHLPSEGLVNGDLLGGVGDMVVAANHVRDLHEGVVDGDDVVVDGHAGRPHQDRIADRLAGKLDIAADDVVEAQGTVGDS